VTGTDWAEIEKDVDAQLERAGVVEHADVGLDRAQVESHARAIAAGQLSKSTNIVPGEVRPAGSEHVESLESLPSDERAELEALGREAIARGRVAVAVLNGGMATRFGGDVKGIIPAIADKTFLEVKLAQARRLGRVPFLIMNSFATHARTLEFLSARGLAAEVEPFLQSVSLRLTPSGDVLRDEEGRVSLYAPGHGDFPGALRRSGLLARLAARGIDTLVLSNIDNLGAELDALVIGFHLARGRALTAELAATLPADVGGAPAFVGGRLQIVEGFRFPLGFDFATVPFMATNTFAISCALLERDHPLSWFYVEKTVGDRTAVQMERLVNELSSFVPTSYLATPRSGPRGRFFPIKTRADLEALRADAGLVRRFSGL
jgi:UTP--glucose-1-phosphate uridylyltransferase